MEARSAKVPNGFRLVTCTECGKQQLVPDDSANENCYCGSFLPRY